ncbi:MAG: methylated-DNA--[protein]-cysteine S-methyltransferase [Hyphomicrobiales bacterium]|nr:methylated-DNA--[protein]-cysteine S-methyltransferase [Hyphomicrobiales bacterium]
MRRLAFFETAIGRCALAWGPAGVAAVRLPGASDAATRAALLRAVPDAVAAPLRDAGADAALAMTALLAGERDETGAIGLDMDGVGAFESAVYRQARAIPAGQTRSYGEIAAALGDPHLARAVGVALGRNPFVIVVPCHRVLAAGKRTGGFSAPGGVATKLRMLEIERAAFGPRDLFSPP